VVNARARVGERFVTVELYKVDTAEEDDKISCREFAVATLMVPEANLNWRAVVVTRKSVLDAARVPRL